MGLYFDNQLSMAGRAGDEAGEALAVIADRYMTLNAAKPVTFRAYCELGIRRAPDYRYEADFNTFFPDAPHEACVVAWSRMWSESGGDLIFDINCYGPLTLYLNGAESWRSDIFTERYPDQHNRITLTLQAGWNHFVIRSKKTPGGFGWRFGSWIGKHPYVFMMPSPERAGQEGWLFSEPLPADNLPQPSAGMSEKDTGIQWNPQTGWSEEARALGNCARLFGAGAGRAAAAWTRVRNPEEQPVTAVLSGHCGGGITVLCGPEEVFASSSSGPFEACFQLQPGLHDLMVICSGDGPDWGFDLSIAGPSGPLQTRCPCELQDSGETWLYAGPFDPDALPDPVSIRDLFSMHQTQEGTGYWKLDAPGCWVRLYNDNPLFGHWNYPLGVTLYGLLHAAMAIGSDSVKQYVRDHVQLSCSTYPYSLWDRSRFGGATHIHHLLSSIDSLDDCGSFGSCLLETAEFCTIEGYEPIARLVGEYITHQQDRFPDGTFQRRKMMHAFHNNTMWADDLYMSVPFLCRYYRLTGDRRYIDDAARQFFGFKKRLYMPERKIMSHVYDIRREVATGVPWGRGNGWTLFSLAELLAVLPEDHASRQDLIPFFRELCEGVLALQDPQGLWHQVLTHPESYPETSCTSMFIYAFSRGVRCGWLDQSDTYAAAALKAWKALTETAVDHEGNVYGVCRGSEFSFSPEYYINDLPWKLNDTHGVGIVLLAGVEVIRLRAYRENTDTELQEIT